MAAIKRVIPIGVNYGINLYKLRGINNVAVNVPAVSLLVNRSQCTSDGYNKFPYRQMSQLVKTDSKRAFLVDTLALSDLVQEANLSKFKSQVQSSQENHFSLLQHETEKLRNDIEKGCIELRYEIDKLTAGQRLDLNLERGSIRDELAKQTTGTRPY